MRITLTKTVGGHEAGATIERSRQVARLLIEHGAAVEAEQIEPTKPRRKRRSQRRADDGDTAELDATTIAADEPAGQEGGGVPPRRAGITAG